ncbi:MAG: penicillin-binding protein 1A, partial [Rhodospirillales bacterium]
LLAAGGLGVLYLHYSRGLPDYQQLADYQPPVMTRVYAGDGRLLSEYAIEKRVFVPVKAMPRPVINAFLAAEDKNFYQHHGVDPLGIVRAAVTNLSHYGSDRRPVGASTITQQVAKNFLLGNEVSLARKAKEMILAFRIEQAIPKDRILELYLNEIYLGFGSYGVAAAALNYFNKPLDQLSVPEAAFLAALPKAPNNYNPVRRPEQAKARRDWVIGRMVEDGYLNQTEGRQAQTAALEVRERGKSDVSRADYFAEEIRRQLVQRYGEAALYKGGLVVRATLDPRLQTFADQALRAGLVAYDRRHGWRGPVARLDSVAGDWAAKLKQVETPKGLGSWQLAVVLDLTDAQAAVGFADGRRGAIPLAEMAWARRNMEKQKLGPPVRKPADALARGDVVAVEQVATDRDERPYPAGSYGLRQLPKAGGAVVALDPHTGRVLAMSGGYDYEMTEFNRATQAMRQMGSAFKPFVYLPALESGFSPTSIILDAPFVIDQGPGQPKWKPANYTHRFYGPSTMRLGVEKSRNLMTVRLAQAVGMDKVSKTARDFGIVEQMPEMLSMALGAAETSLLKLTAAYAMLVNGGKRIAPTLIDRVQDRHGKTVFRHDTRECPGCGPAPADAPLEVPVPPDTRAAVIDPVTAYQMVSMLQGVVERGTATRLRELHRPLAGKTGTTNDSTDAWFVGFTPDLAVGVYVGFDAPATLGQQEQGASVAVPIFKQFMEQALKEAPSVQFRIPPGVRLVRVSAETGLPARPGDRDVILEAFRPGSEPAPGRETVVLDGGQPLQGSPVGAFERPGAGAPAPGLY